MNKTRQQELIRWLKQQSSRAKGWIRLSMMLGLLSGLLILAQAWLMAGLLQDRKSTRLNSSHTEIYTLSLHDALPISTKLTRQRLDPSVYDAGFTLGFTDSGASVADGRSAARSEEHTSELQSHRDLHSFPTRRSSDLNKAHAPKAGSVCL